MSTSSTEAASKAPPTSTLILPKQSGIRTVLRYTGIPPSWLDKRPKMPSRNWLIFLSVTSSAFGMYFYDRRQCKLIRQEYVDKVKHLAELPADPFENPRRVTVYGAKWPGDDDHDQALRHFRRYVKPILVAAAVDYTMVPGKRHGDIARHVAEQVRLQRREDTGVDEDSEITKTLPTYKPLAERRKGELQGGVVLVGRPTFKEYMFGLKKGWTDGLDKVDKEEKLARAFDDDTVFDELPDEPVGLVGGEESSLDAPSNPISAFPSSQTSPIFSPMQMALSSPSSSPSQSLKTSSKSQDSHSPPTVIAPQPPILFVPFLNYIGFKQIPIMCWDWFNQRHKVRSGAEAGYKLVMDVTRSIEVPESIAQELSAEDSLTTRSVTEKNSSPPSDRPLGDLDFDTVVEWYYNSSALRLPEDTEKARKNYYAGLPKKLAVARELSRGTREPTTEEMNYPPPTEVELRAERMKKEKRWREDVEGWGIVDPSKKIAWDERFRYALRVFADPPEENKVESFTTNSTH
ncbi:inner membrane protein import complex subunit Tim54-domain-containing protein [Crepidotus variabilis]|uniref:Mitochondrial import inner membrane translocase subunit TIM54 n=1 Tax=Crepidotus variabilis TaxID=179855 RepID=A0A9P6EDB7_9AGAR|nr:inner membrane protein import complex subunit Tim54-domain-containing protein [Crepidotus variabilis]